MIGALCLRWGSKQVIGGWYMNVFDQLFNVNWGVVLFDCSISSIECAWLQLKMYHPLEIPFNVTLHSDKPGLTIYTQVFLVRIVDDLFYKSSNNFSSEGGISDNLHLFIIDIFVFGQGSICVEFFDVACPRIRACKGCDWRCLWKSRVLSTICGYWFFLGLDFA